MLARVVSDIFSFPLVEAILLLIYKSSPAQRVNVDVLAPLYEIGALITTSSSALNVIVPDPSKGIAPAFTKRFCSGVVAPTALPNVTFAVPAVIVNERFVAALSLLIVLLNKTTSFEVVNIMSSPVNMTGP